MDWLHARGGEVHGLMVLYETKQIAAHWQEEWWEG